MECDDGSGERRAESGGKTSFERENLVYWLSHLSWASGEILEYKSNNIKIGVNDMTVNDSESLVNTGDISPEIA